MNKNILSQAKELFALLDILELQEKVETINNLHKELHIHSPFIN